MPTTSEGVRVVRGHRYRTLALGGVPTEVVKVLRPAKGMPGPGWWIVRFESDGATVCGHESRLAEEVLDSPAPARGTP